ncbi:MAG: hypothetical protein JO212_05055 [Acetobacteraceae bacterium]|nr:hypothetical protein [Acetobacteraceae bacterium]
MKRMLAIAIAAASLLLAGQGTLRAAGQPQCDSGQTAGAAPGQKYGTSSDVAAKKQMDTEKYQTAGANSAKEAC